MCAIAGLLNFAVRMPRERLKEMAEGMAGAMAHRGPDARGSWVSEDGRCALAHRRLSVIDLSAGADQPMRSSDGRLEIVFNGEIYNYLELRQELEGRGVRFRTQSDTEVLMEAWRLWGAAALEKFDGMFAFGLFDSKSGELVLARDPFGEKPLYYTDAGGGFAFASELHALRGVPGFSADIDLDTVLEYLLLQYINAPRTLYRCARKLPPGHYLRVNAAGGFELRRYFEFQPGGGEYRERKLDDLADELEELLLRSLRRRLVSDVPLGAFLSGGLDSSLIAALVRRKLGRPLETFSIGFAETEWSEHAFARSVAQRLGTTHRDIILDPDVVEGVAQIGRILDEPNADTSCLPVYLLSEFARRHVTVALSGDGADELFGGYMRYETVVGLQEQIRRGERAVMGWTPGSAYFANKISVVPLSQLTELCANPPVGFMDRFGALEERINNSPLPLLHRLRACDVGSYLPGAVLAKVDRMSMQHALEVRSPYLNVEVARFAEKLAPEQLLHEGTGKRVVRHLAARYLEPEVLARPKTGFGLPQAQWAQERLLEHANRLFVRSQPRLGEWISPAHLQAYLGRCRGVARDYTRQLWSLAILEEYLRRHGGSFVDTAATVEQATAIHSLIECNRPVDVYTQDRPPGWVLACGARQAGDGATGAASAAPGAWKAWRIERCGPASTCGALSGGKPIVVILSDIGEIEGQAAVNLYERGIREIRLHQNGRWRRFRIERRRHAGGLSRVLGEWLRNWRARLVKALSLRVPVPSRSKEPRRGARSPEQGRKQLFHPQGDFAYRVRIIADGCAEQARERGERCILFEDGTPLPLSHSNRHLIRTRGAGRYVAEGFYLYFSSSDNTDPNDNGRNYRVSFRKGWGWTLLRLFGCHRSCWTAARTGDAAISMRPLSDGDGRQYREAPRRYKTQLKRALASPRGGGGMARRVALVTSHLGAGGAERQICHVAILLKQHGWEPAVLTIERPRQGSDHYLPELTRWGIPIRTAHLAADAFDWRKFLDLGPLERSLLRGLPEFLRERVWNLFTHLAAWQPSVVHCFLDRPNVVGSLAGWFAGAGRLVMSFRSVNPTHFRQQESDTEGLREYYRMLAESPLVQLSGNSEAGNRDYASWLGVSPGRIALVRNILDAERFRPADPDAREAARARMGIAAGTPVIAGVFRLSHEKGPLRFIDVVDRVRGRIPGLRVLLAGDGPLAGEVDEAIRVRRLEETVLRVGLREDVATIMGASDVVLLTSDYEGTPNVILEAQAMGVPVVASAVGGVPESMADGETGFAVAGDDPDLLAGRCAELLENVALRSRFGARGRSFVQERFNRETGLRANLALYGAD